MCKFCDLKAKASLLMDVVILVLFQDRKIEVGGTGSGSLSILPSSRVTASSRVTVVAQETNNAKENDICL